MFLRLLNEGRSRFRRTFANYWLDQLVEQVLAGQKPGAGVTITGKVLAVVRCDVVGAELVVPGVNIVTNAGDLYYAEMAAGETPTDDFDGASAGLRLGSATTSPAKGDDDVTTFLAGSALALDASYPTTDDGDGDNSGAGADIVTWRFSYGTGDGNVNGIAEGAIVDDRTTPTAALSHFLFAASFDKTSSDTLKVFVNHTFNGT